MATKPCRAGLETFGSYGSGIRDHQIRSAHPPWRCAALASGALALVALGLAGCSSSGGTSAASTTPSAVPTSHTLTLSFLQDPGQPPDPAVYYAGQGLLLQDNMYDGLVQYQAGTAQRQIIPD